MNMAVTIDPRPTYFGDRMVVTGSYTATETTIELGDLLASVDAFTLNPSSVTLQNVDSTPADDGGTLAILALMDSATVSGTTVTIHPAAGGSTKAGTFLAIGRRN